MSSPAIVAGPAQLFDVPGLGHFSIAPDPKVPLLVVFGGIDVHKVQSGVYMWNYMNNLKNRFHIFVATSNSTSGTQAYQAVMKIVQAKSLTPAKQILYLFSGGYQPGMQLLPTIGSSVFSTIYLVDIWMGLGKHHNNPVVQNFYMALADSNAGKMYYIHTEFGADNPKARDYISKKLGPAKAILVPAQGKEGGMDTHLRTNVVAVSTLV